MDMGLSAPKMRDILHFGPQTSTAYLTISSAAAFNLASSACMGFIMGF